jgi:hypothetical protein
MNAILIVFFALLQVADGVVTYLGLGLASVDEVNPVLGVLIELFGLGGSITLLKLAWIQNYKSNTICQNDLST